MARKCLLKKKTPQFEKQRLPSARIKLHSARRKFQKGRSGNVMSSPWLKTKRRKQNSKPKTKQSSLFNFFSQKLIS